MKKRIAGIMVIIMGILSILSGCGNRPIDRLEKAVEAEDIELVAKILKENPGMDLNQNTYRGFLMKLSGDPCFPPLHRACSVGNYEIVKMLIEAGADVNFCDPHANNSPIEITAVESPRSECISILRLLIQNGANIQSTPKLKEDTKYWYFNVTVNANEEKNYQREQEVYEFFKYLIENGITFEEYNLMKHAIIYENVPVLNYALHNMNADINKIQVTYDSEGKSHKINYLIMCLDSQKLMKAYTNDTLKVLLENGIDVTFVDSYGKTALDYAKEYNNTEAVELIQAKIDTLE